MPRACRGEQQRSHVSLLLGSGGQNQRVSSPSASPAASAKPNDRQPPATLTAQRLVGLFATGLLLLNFPLLALWDRPITVAGLPLFPLALFGIWAGLIAALAWLMETAAD